MAHGNDRPADTDETPLTTVANPRRVRVGADGRPETTPATEPGERS